jgi:hypothetical protein
VDFLSSRPAWSIEGAPGQPDIHRETLSPKTQKLKKKKKKSLRSFDHFSVLVYFSSFRILVFLLTVFRRVF